MNEYLKQALYHRDHGNLAEFCVSLRRFSDDTKDLNSLLDFIRPQDRWITRLAAMAAAHTILERESVEVSEVFRCRVEKLAFKYLDHDWLISGPNKSLAKATFIVATLIPVDNVEKLAYQLVNLDIPRMRSEVCRILNWCRRENSILSILRD